MKTKTSTQSQTQDYELLNAPQAAYILEISVRQLHRLRRRGEILATRIGWRHWGFFRHDIRAYKQRLTAKNQRSYFAPYGTERKLAFDETNPIEEATVVRVANAILTMALDKGASDIHIDMSGLETVNDSLFWETPKYETVVRCRVDGRLQEITTAPYDMHVRLLNRFMVMANINPIPTPVPQIGFLKVTYKDRSYDIRLSILPGQFFDVAVLHILDQSLARKGLEALGMAPEIVSDLNTLITRGEGLILFAGPSGSGRTTTAQALLHGLNSGERELHILEEPSEHRQPNVLVQESAIYRYQNPNDWLKRVQRQNSDLFFAGDIRDRQSAAVAVEAALSGKLTFAVLSAADAVDSVRALTDLGIAPERLARCLKGVVAQRLVRRLCPDCREACFLPARELSDFGCEPFRNEAVPLYRGAGCETCDRKGAKGRIGLFEFLRVNPETAELLRPGAGRGDLYASAIAGGMKPQRTDAWEKALSGYIAIEDARRALDTRIARLTSS